MRSAKAEVRDGTQRPAVHARTEWVCLWQAWPRRGATLQRVALRAARTEHGGNRRTLVQFARGTCQAWRRSRGSGDVGHYALSTRGVLVLMGTRRACEQTDTRWQQAQPGDAKTARAAPQ